MAWNVFLPDDRVDEEDLGHRDSSESVRPAVVSSLLNELIEGHPTHAWTEEDSAPGAVVGFAFGRLGHLQKAIAVGKVGGIGVEVSADVWIVDSNEDLIQSFGADEIENFPIVLGPEIGGVVVVAEVDPQKADLPLAQNRMRHRPAGRSYIPAGIHARETVHFMNGSRQTV